MGLLRFGRGKNQVTSPGAGALYGRKRKSA
jgi:hypothetical protein